jgi:hypothetical protein
MICLYSFVWFFQDMEMFLRMLHDNLRVLFDSFKIWKCSWECYMIIYEVLFDSFKIWECSWEGYMIISKVLFDSFKIWCLWECYTWYFLKSCLILSRYGNLYENITHYIFWSLVWSFQDMEMFIRIFFFITHDNFWSLVWFLRYLKCSWESYMIFYEVLFNSFKIWKCLWECHMIFYERLFDFFKVWKCLWECYMIFSEVLFNSFKIWKCS